MEEYTDLELKLIEILRQTLKASVLTLEMVLESDPQFCGGDDKETKHVVFLLREVHKSLKEDQYFINSLTTD